MAIIRFFKQICNNLKIKICNALFAWLTYKFDVSMELIKTTQKGLKFLLTMCPDKKNIVNLSKPHQTL